MDVLSQHGCSFIKSYLSNFTQADPFSPLRREERVRKEVRSERLGWREKKENSEWEEFCTPAFYSPLIQGRQRSLNNGSVVTNEKRQD